MTQKMNVDTTSGNQAGCGYEREQDDAVATGGLPELPADLWLLIFHHMEEYDPVVKMCILLWNCLVLPLVCRSWRAILFKHRLMRLQQIKKYMAAPWLELDAEERARLPDAWFLLCVRNNNSAESPSLFAKFGDLLDFAMVMLAGSGGDAFDLASVLLSFGERELINSGIITLLMVHSVECQWKKKQKVEAVVTEDLV